MTGTEIGAGPLSKKNQTSDPTQTGETLDITAENSGTPNDTAGSEMDMEGSGSEKEVNNTLHPPPPIMGVAQWQQIMSRFDKFEKSIQATIKEEIKVNSVGLQKQVKSLNTKVKEVERNISANKNETAKINQKVSNLDNLQGIIAAEVHNRSHNNMNKI